MGQKVNPHGARVGVIKDWSTRWYADKKNFADNLVSDAKLRKMIKELEFVDDKSKKPVKLYDAGISSIDIERRFDNDKVRVTVNAERGEAGHRDRRERREHREDQGCDREGAGRAERAGHPQRAGDQEARSGRAARCREHRCAAGEPRVLPPRDEEVPAELYASLARRVSRPALPVGLGGADIARSEGYHEGSIPLQTLRADIDYGFAEAKTAYGRLGVKVWIYKGQVLPTAEESSGQDRRRQINHVDAQESEAPPRLPRPHEGQGPARQLPRLRRFRHCCH